MLYALSSLRAKRGNPEHPTFSAGLLRFARNDDTRHIFFCLLTCRERPVKNDSFAALLTCYN